MKQTSEEAKITKHDLNSNEFTSLDSCLNDKMNDAFNYVKNLSIPSTLAGHTSPKLRPSDKKVPTINVLLNSSLGQEKPVLITALLDSGGSECLISDKIAKKLYIHKETPKTWSTAAGNFTTIGRTKTQFKFPELRE